MGIKDLTDADLKKIEDKLKNVGINIDTTKIRKSIEAGIGATPFNATVTFGNARASLDALFANNKYGIHVEAIASKLHDSIKGALDGWKGAEAPIIPKKRQLRKAVSDALLSAGFEINIDKIRGLNATIKNALGTPHTLSVSVDPQKLASAIDKAAKTYKGKDIPVEIKEKVLKDSIRKALKSEKFHIKVVVDKAEAQDAVRQALQAAGLQSSTGFTASDKRAWDAQSNRMIAQGKAAAANALAQQRLASAQRNAARAASSHTSASISLSSAMRGNIRIAGQLGPMLASAYSVVALKNFMKHVIEIGGELEKQKLAMNAILGDKGFGNAITSQINTLAVKSPFGVMELNQYAKQLTAFQIPYNELYDTMKRMADVSAAVGVDMGRIILAYGQVRAAKFLKGCLGKGTLVTMLNGSQKKVENVVVGDVVMGDDEKGRNVLSLIRNREMMYVVSYHSGSFRCNENHILTMYDCETGKIVDVCVLDYLKDADKYLGVRRVNGTYEYFDMSVKQDCVDDYYGFEIDGNKRFMIEDNVVTHNTELRQFTEANIPMIDMLAQRFTKLKGEMVSAGDIMDMISKKEISFEDVKAVLWELTSEGGRFYNMQEVLSESVQAKWKNLADAIDLMFADIANSTSGALKGMAELLTALTQKWAQVGMTVASAAVSFGLYKGAVAVMNMAIAANTRVTTANTRAVGMNLSIWKLLQRSIGRGWNNALNSVKSFFTNGLNYVKMGFGALGAALTAAMYLWERNREEMQAVKQLGEDLFTGATEGAKNLKQVLDSMPLSSRGLSDVELSASVEKLRQTIKDYSSTAEKDLLGALVNQKGEVASLAEQYEILIERIQQLHRSMSEDAASQMSKTLAAAIEDADSGWFDDNLLTDVKDFSGAFEDSQKYLSKAIKENQSQIAGLVKKAKELSPTFAEATRYLKTDEQAFAELIRGFGAGKWMDMVGLDKKTFQLLSVISSGYVREIRGARTEFQNEFRQTVQAQIDRLAVEGITPENVSPEQKTRLIEWFNKVTEGLPEEGKMLARRLFENMWKVDIDNGNAERAVVDAFGRIFEAANPELSKRLKAGMKINDLELLDYSNAHFMVAKAADEVMKEMPLFKDKIQSYLNDNQFQARVLVEWQGLNADSDLKKMLWSGDEDNLHTYAFGAEKIFDQMAAGAKSTRDVRENYIKEGKDIKERIKAAKANNAAAAELEKLNTEWNLHAESFRRAHFGDLEAAIKEKGGRQSQTDAFADNLKQRFKDIKDAWSEFQKWSKTEGREAAAKRIGESGLFSTLSADKIPQTVEQYRALVVELENELRQAGVKGTARESLLNELLKQLLDIDKTVVDEQLRLALDKVSKEAERQLADWNLFDKIRKATGSQDLAMSIAFGMNADAETDYPAMIKQQLQKTVDAAEAALSKGATPYEVQGYNYDKLKKLYDARDSDEGMEAWTKVPEEIRNTWEKANGDILKYFDQQRDAVADILNEYQSLQDKLAKIDSDRDRKIQTVQKSDMSAPDKAKYTQRINVEADYQKFTQSADYLKFFSGIYSLTMQQAQEIGDKIRLNLDQRLQAGTISAEDYYKEIGRINQQLTKLRNVKSDALTFMTGGVKGLNQKKLEIADSNVLDQMTKVQQAQEALEVAKKTGDIKQIAAAEQTLNLAKTELDTRIKIRDAIVKDMEGWQKVLDVVNVVANIGQGLSDAFNSIREMAGAFGVDTESGGWEAIGGVLDTVNAVTGGVQKVVQSAMNGDIGGILSGAVSTITTPFTIWSQLHDKKLQKLIERSKQAAQIMQNQYDILEKRMANFLGNAADMKVEGYTGQGGAYGKQRELMQGQLRELEKQRQAEMDKKKPDSSVVEDYNRQIEEMKIAIRDFAIEAAKDLYGIDLNGWAEQLGDSLVDAFAKGEDAAAAFDKTVGDIMRDVVSKMISQDILAPMFGDLRNFLFGADGVSGAFGSDFKLDASETAAMKTYLDKIKDEGIPAAEELFNAINNATGGLLDDTDRAKSGLSAGIQSVTEDTADLLASYINAIRASVAMNEGRWERLLGESLPQISVIAQSQLDAQRQIAENTLRTAKATEAIVESNDEINRLLTRATQGGAKFYIH